MGQILSGDNISSIYLYVLNCSKHNYWLHFGSDRWERVEINHNVIAVECRQYSEVLLYNESKEKCLRTFNMETRDKFVHIKEVKKNKRTDQIEMMDWPVSDANRRPFYLIAHKVNQPEDIEKVLYTGANACEIDVRFDTESRMWYVNYDYAGGITVTKWFLKARESVLPLVVVDVKTPCPGWQLTLLLDQIRMSKFQHAILLSVATQVDCLLSVEHKLHANEGLATDYLKISPELMAKLPENANLWYGNGIISMLPKPGLYNSIRDAVYLRNNGKKIKKVYAWTFDSAYSFSEYLGMDLDGIMVEQDFVSEARSLVEKSPFYRMAEVKDDAFKKSVVTCKDMNKRS